MNADDREKLIEKGAQAVREGGFAGDAYDEHLSNTPELVAAAVIDALQIEDLAIEEHDTLTGETYPTFRLGALSAPTTPGD